MGIAKSAKSSQADKGFLMAFFVDSCGRALEDFRHAVDQAGFV